MKSERLFLLLPAAAIAGVVFAQGPLTPPGAPGPVMKTLGEIEPRTNLQAVPAPAGVDTTNADYHFIITQPGSYYLSANVGVTKLVGIQINTEGVTIDLNGFQISRASGTDGAGIDIPPTSHRASVRNGSIKGFIYGIHCATIGAGYARACAFRDLAASGSTFAGIYAGDGAGIHSTGTDNRIEGNNVSENDRGIDVDGSGSLIIKKSAAGNTTDNYDIAASNRYGQISFDGHRAGGRGALGAPALKHNVTATGRDIG